MDIFSAVLIILIVVWTLITVIRKAPIVVTIPKFWYDGITIGWLVIIKREVYSDRILVHEYIHFLQQRELFWVLAYPIYIVELIFKSIYYRSLVEGYYAVSFEREARMFQDIDDYPFRRKPYLWRYFIVMDKIFTLPKYPSEEEFQTLYSMKRASIFKFEGDFSTAYKTINKNLPEGKTFEVKHVRPGTSLYATYGEGTLVVTKSDDILVEE